MEERFCDKSPKYRNKYLEALESLYKCPDKANLETVLDTLNEVNPKYKGK
jgi:hypothetical protein